MHQPARVTVHRREGAAAPGVASGLLWFLHRSWIVSPRSDLDVLYVAASLVRRVPPSPSPRCACSSL